MSQRLERLREVLRERDAAAVLLSRPADIRWAVGFRGSNALLAVTADAAHFITDGRYITQAAEEVTGAEIHTPGDDLAGHVESLRLLGDGGKVLISADDVTLAEFDKLVAKLPGYELVPSTGLITRLRASKEEGEIESIRRAQALTEAVFEHILPMIAVDVSERDLAAEIAYQHLKTGASAMAFEPIVASGRRAALPHARASSKPIAAGDVVLIDMGCYLDGYASDMTRTLVVGDAEPALAAAYDAVLEAQLAAIQTIRAGISTVQPDAAARAVLAEHGLEEYFTHSTGHGLGLEVHEWPRLSRHVDEPIPQNAVLTVEPGVYLPERFGIRIEDLVVARADGAEVLTRTPKSLLVL